MNYLQRSTVWLQWFTAFLAIAAFSTRLAAEETPITAEQAKQLATTEAKKLNLKPHLFHIVVDTKPFTYASLLEWAKNSTALRDNHVRRLLEGRRFWVVRFEIP